MVALGTEPMPKVGGYESDVADDALSSIDHTPERFSGGDQAGTTSPRWG